MKTEIKIFISYAKEDYTFARQIYCALKKDGFAPWLDREDILPGQNWKHEIFKAIKDSRYFILILSKKSISKRGFIQKEIKIALDILDEFPKSETFIIPVRVENCLPIDEQLQDLQWLDLFQYSEHGLGELVKRINKIGKLKNNSREIKPTNILTQKKYYISNYLCVYPLNAQNDNYLLFSTINSASAMIPKLLLDQIDNCSLDPEVEDTLSTLKFIRTDLQDEKREVLWFIDKVNSLVKRYFFTVILGFGCNFSCKYCTQNTSSVGKMTKDTADELIAFLLFQCGNEKKDLVLNFYGGEPFIYIEMIKYISSKLNEEFKKSANSFSFNINTNGSLVNSETISQLKYIGLDSITITLDGPREIHNANRPLSNGHGSFDVIIGNLKNISGVVKININGSFDRNSFGSVPNLIEFLYHSGLRTEEIGLLNFTPLEEAIVDAQKNDCQTSYEPWMIEAIKLINTKAISYGYNVKKIEPSLCSISLDNSFTIDIDGLIYKCVMFASKKDFSIGDIRKGLRFNLLKYKIDLWKDNTCGDCKYLPLCWGGCRYLSSIRDKGTINKDCKREYFEKYLGELVKSQLSIG